MITIEFGSDKIVIEKPYYKLIDSNLFQGESSKAKIHSGGKTDIIDTRVDKTGSIKQIGLRLQFLDSTERNAMRDMAIGENRSSVSDPIKIRLTDEPDLNGMYECVYDEETDFYKESERKEDLDNGSTFYDVEVILLRI